MAQLEPGVQPSVLAEVQDAPRPEPNNAAAPRIRPQRIVVLVPADRTRVWAMRLTDALGRRLGTPVALATVPVRAAPPLPSEALEGRLFGAGVHGHSAWAPTGGGIPPADGAAIGQLFVNATGRDLLDLPSQICGAPVLSPIFHGASGLEGLAGPTLADKPPHLGVVMTCGGGRWLLHGIQIATPDRAVTPRLLDSVLGRTITLLIGAAEHIVAGKPLPEPVPVPPPWPAPSGARFWTRRLLHDGAPKLGRKLVRPLIREDWCVGYRMIRQACSPTELSLTPDSFELLPCRADRYFADPFLFQHDGVTVLFLEDYDHAAARGRISHMILGENGERGPVTETLSRPYHLSYPFVFRHEGAALMIPETSGNRTIELYQAERFPDRWRLKSVLIEDIDAADTTPYFDRSTGLWWLFATVCEFGDSSHDTLSLFFSERIYGPWRPHPGNPVKFDPASSRPAGPLIPWQGRLFRPAQDCAFSYGAGLTWCEIETLTPHRFQERVVSRHAPGHGFTGMHTYVRAAGFEAVDFLRNRWRLGDGSEKTHHFMDLAPLRASRGRPVSVNLATTQNP